jgi:chromosome partitioning protein
MQIITLCSFKGGTSKTSAALSVGSCLAKYHNKRILLIDSDAQANLSIGLGLGADLEATLVPLLKGHSEIRAVIHETNVPNLYLIPSNAYLDSIERSPELAGDPYAHERLRKALKEVENDFDYCFIDTPPSLGWLTQSAFFASTYNLICAIPEAYSVLALRRLKEFQNSINQYHPIKVLGVVISFWDERGAVNTTVLEEIEKQFPSKLFHTKIRRDITVSRAVFQGSSIFEFAPKSNAAVDYKNLNNLKQSMVND